MVQEPGIVRDDAQAHVPCRECLLGSRPRREHARRHRHAEIREGQVVMSVEPHGLGIAVEECASHDASASHGVGDLRAWPAGDVRVRAGVRAEVVTHRDRVGHLLPEHPCLGDRAHPTVQVHRGQVAECLHRREPLGTLHAVAPPLRQRVKMLSEYVAVASHLLALRGTVRVRRPRCSKVEVLVDQELAGQAGHAMARIALFVGLRVESAHTRVVAVAKGERQQPPSHAGGFVCGEVSAGEELEQGQVVLLPTVVARRPEAPQALALGPLGHFSQQVLPSRVAGRGAAKPEEFAHHGREVAPVPP